MKEKQQKWKYLGKYKELSVGFFKMYLMTESKIYTICTCIHIFNVCKYDI